MKSIIIVLLVSVCTYAAVEDESKAAVLRSSYDNQPDGGFQYTYETANGIVGQAQGALKQLGKDEVALQVQGSNQWKTPEGENVQLTYVADENGYQPQGSHLPTTPAPLPIPEYIARALEYIAAHPYVEKKP